MANPVPSIQVTHSGRWLTAEFSTPQSVLSWAVYRGGKTRADTIAWYEVSSSDLRGPVDPREFIKTKLLERSLPDAVGLLTSRKLDAYIHRVKSLDDLAVQVIATVGLSNALRVGDPPAALKTVGTINLLCHLSVPLSEEAFLEAMAVAAEARSAAILDAGISSTVSGLPATGTGTDCIVIAAPDRPSELHYIGKHTSAGSLLGAAVFEAVLEGARSWQRENRHRIPNSP